MKDTPYWVEGHQESLPTGSGGSMGHQHAPAEEEEGQDRGTSHGSAQCTFTGSNGAPKALQRVQLEGCSARKGRDISKDALYENDSHTLDILPNGSY